MDDHSSIAVVAALLHDAIGHTPDVRRATAAARMGGRHAAAIPAAAAPTIPWGHPTLSIPTKAKTTPYAAPTELRTSPSVVMRGVLSAVFANQSTSVTSVCTPIVRASAASTGNNDPR